MSDVLDDAFLPVEDDGGVHAVSVDDAPATATSNARSLAVGSLPTHIRERRELLMLGMLLDASAGEVAEVARFLSAEHFADPGRGLAFEVLTRARPEGEPRFLAAYHALLVMDPGKTPRDQRRHERAIHALFTAEMSWKYHAATLLPNAVRLWKSARALQLEGLSSYAAQRLREGHDPADVVPELLEQLREELKTMRSMGEEPATVAGDSAFVEALLSPSEPDDGLVTSGWTDFDRHYRGLAPGKLVVVAARPSIGKTTFALNWAWVMASERNRPPLFVSLEMSRGELERALLARHSRIDADNLSSEPDRVARAARDLRESRFTIADPQRDFGIDDLEAAIERYVAGGECRSVWIDYLTLMKLPKAERRDLAVGEVTRRVKQLARAHRVPIVVLSQLNRGVESREGQRPRLSDLRDSGSIEQDADDVLLLSRGGENQLRVDVAKQRNGPTGECKLAVLPAQHRVESLYDELDSIS